ncbi:haloacid dehalogenase-like hydrolase [Natronorubrum halophilum]|uniref:haloacid dehalogenase-like hydrolase n=1 Tax=Natronorubrum halophilum TaxID=1702106 RepID=UPI000EF73E6C|nr:HAD family hydrolase [Natronorubrum halophilum]
MSTNIGLIFDFDDTLAPDSTTQLLREYGCDPQEFWSAEFSARVKEGYDPTVAYLSLLLDKVGEDRPFGELTIEDLESVGATLNEMLYPGLSGLFGDIRAIVDEYTDVSVNFYIVSEGLEPIIKGTEIADHCEAIYGSRLDIDAEGVVNRIQRPISFTDKTRYLYEINKGISPESAQENPYRVNTQTDPEDRRIPFENMIYIGDGITDIPCFSLIKDRGGRVFGVINSDDGSAKQRAIREIGSPRRAGNLNRPSYGEGGRLGSLLRLTIEGICTDRAIDRLEAL